MQETSLLFKVSVPVQIKNELLCMNRINWLSTFPTISKGDILLNTLDPSTVYFWDGYKVIKSFDCQEIETESTLVVPPEFLVLVDFAPETWEQVTDDDTLFFTDFTKLNIISTQQVQVTHREINLVIWVYTIKYQGILYEIVSETEMSGNLTILQDNSKYSESITGFTFSERSYKVYDSDNFIEI